MKAPDIIAIIEKFAPLGIAAAWDASGVQVASFQRDIRSVAVMLDPTLESVRQAADDGADFILAHHPLSMKPRFPNAPDDYLALLSVLLAKNIWLYSAHTSLDANPRGPVLWLARALELTGQRVLESVPCPPDIPKSPADPASSEAFGFGFCGDLQAALPYVEFCARLAACLGKGEWQCCGPVPDTVSRVAYCPGAGGSLLSEVLASGADVFITGDIRYHTALDALAGGIRILDVGHFILEEEMMRRFAQTLATELTVPVRFWPGKDPLAGERIPFTA